MEEATKKKKRKKKRRLSFLYILGGGIFKEDFILKHIKLIGLIVFMTFLFVGNQYSCLLKIKEIDTLQKRLHDVKLEALTISVELAEYSRQSRVEALIKEQHLNLESATTPPYELHR